MNVTELKDFLDSLDETMPVIVKEHCEEGWSSILEEASLSVQYVFPADLKSSYVSTYSQWELNQKEKLLNKECWDKYYTHMREEDSEGLYKVHCEKWAEAKLVPVLVIN